MRILTIIQSVIVTSLFGFLAASGNVYAADASATYFDVCSNGREGVHPYDCVIQSSDLLKEKLLVTITPDARHAGMAGAFYIGVRTDGNIRGIFTPNGWTGWAGGLFEPAARMNSMPSGAKNFYVLDGGFICAQIGPGVHEMWAGYGVLNDKGQYLAKNYKNYVSKGITYEHLVQTYVQHEMTESKRAWPIFNITCPIVASGP